MDWDTLTAAQKRTYRNAVTQTHHRRVEVAIQRLDGHTIHTFTNHLMDGQWDADVTSTPESTLSGMQVFDPDGVLNLRELGHRRFQAQVTDSRFVPAFDEWVDVVIHTGPLWDFTRNGPVVTFTARGSEQLAMGSVRRTYSKPAKTRATVVIDDLLGMAGVPKRLRRVPNLKVRLPDAVTVRIKKRVDGKDKDKKRDDIKLTKRRRIKLNHEDTYLGSAQEVVEAINRTLSTDGKGRFIVRKHPTKPALTVDERLLTEPVETRRVGNEDLHNVFIVVGKKPKGRKKRIRAEARFPARHPSSAESLAPWNGDKPYELIRITRNDKIDSHKRGKQIAQRQRDREMREVVEYGVAIAPVAPWLRPGDLVRVRESSVGTVTVRARQMSLPLTPGGGSQTIGSLRRVSAGSGRGSLTWTGGRVVR